MSSKKEVEELDEETRLLLERMMNYNGEKMHQHTHEGSKGVDFIGFYTYQLMLGYLANSQMQYQLSVQS